MRPRTFLRGLACALALSLGACSDPAEELHAQLAAGEAALEAGDASHAVPAFKSALQIDPNDVGAHWGLARAYLSGNRITQALWELDETVRLAPDHHRARIELARLLRFGNAEEQEAAVAHAQHVIDAEALDEGDPERWAAWLAKGRALAALDRPDPAREAFETAAKLAPDEGAPPFVLGRFLEDHGDRAGAEAQYRRLRELEPGFDSTLVMARFLARERERDADAEALYRDALAEAAPGQQVVAYQALAGFLYARGRFDEAVAAIEAGLAARPDDPDLVAALAGLYQASGQPDRAEATLTAAAGRAAADDPLPALRLADFRRGRGDVAGALEATEAAIAAGGGSEARLRKAELLIQSSLAGGEPDARTRGRAIVDSELAKDDGLPEARLVSGWIDLLDGRPESAARSARRALDRRPDWPRAHLLLGRALLAQGELRGARNELERTLVLEPGSVEAHRRLAMLLLRTGDAEAALEHARDALRANPDDHAVRLVAADALLAAGRPDEAAGEVARIPDAARNAEALYAQGQLQAAAGDLEGGRQTLLRALEAAPHRIEVIEALFEIDQRTGRAADTVDRVDAALAERPNEARLHRLAGRAAMALGADDAAEGALRRAIELDPNDLTSYGVLAQFMAESGREEAIVESYEQAVAANPNVGVLRATLARLHEATGREDEAMAGYEEALRLDPSLAVAKANLAWLLAERDTDLDRALDLAQEAKAALPDLPDAADTLGWVLYKKGIPSAAVGYLQEAERLLPPGHPQLPLVRLHLALALEANGETAKARQVVDRALGATPDAPAGGSVAEELRALRETLPEPAETS
ncbi:MAG TPA: tetratricopeptide repeat protein [Myxococcota bacterium]|nr:tetratricopeptide repeat protein [Myxococcota bacterium]